MDVGTLGRRFASGAAVSPRTALITVTFNSSDDLSSHWYGARDLNADWYVVDNASVDDSADVAEGLGATVIRLPRNLGFSAANNVGAERAGADCYIFLNPDVTPTAEGIRELARMAIERNALVAPQLTNPDGTLQENGRRLPYIYRKILHFIGHRRSLEQYEVTAVAGEVKDIAWAIGAAIAIPAEVFEKLGGWDSKFFVYYEDSDICLRARALGIATLLAGDVRWMHSWARATRRRGSLLAWRLEVSSAITFYRRYPWLLTHPRLARRIEPREILEGALNHDD